MVKIFLRRGRADVLLNAVSVVLAGSCAFFAVLMILRLDHMENPPADLGLNFKPGDMVTRVQPIRFADLDVTGSIDQVETARPRPNHLPIARDHPAVQDFRLLTVIDGVAFVEISGPLGKEIWPASEGAVLPGAGRVLQIVRDHDRWQVTAARLTITGER